MNNRIRTAFTLTAVMVAGSSAVLINTQVLADTKPAGTALPTLAANPATADITQPATADMSNAVSATISGSGTTDTTAITQDADAAQQPPVVAATDATVAATEDTTPATTIPSTQAVYRLDGVGNITLDTAGDTLKIAAVAPQAGWTVTGIDQLTPLNTAVHLQSGATVVTFTATLLFGVVGTSIDTRTLNTGSQPVATAPPATAPSGDNSNSRTDDSEDDEHEDDEHEDHGREHHEDEDQDDD